MPLTFQNVAKVGADNNMTISVANLSSPLKARIKRLNDIYNYVNALGWSSA